MRDRRGVAVPMTGLIVGLIACVVIWNLHIPDLPVDGQKCLALVVMTIIWWTTKAMPTPFVSAAVLLAFVLLLDSEVVPGTTIFSIWSNPIMYLVISGFLIAEAVKQSGLAKRLALLFIRRFIRSYNGIIISCYVLGVLLSLAIPHPWPRSFLLLSVMPHVMEAAKLEKKWFAPIAIAIFAGSTTTSMVFFTGDSTMNSMVGQLAGENLSWVRWFVLMSVPGLSASALMCAIQIRVFGEPEVFTLDPERIGVEMNNLGKLTGREIKCAVAILLAILCWVTDGIHGIHPGWVALGAVVVMALPFMDVVDVPMLSSVSLSTLLFMTASIAIGSVSAASGMSDWMVRVAVPASVPTNPFLFAALTCGICMVIHMIMGNALSVLIITAPIIVAMAELAGIPAILGTVIAYISLTMHWILPFHNMTMTVGLGAGEGGYTERDVLKMGLPQTATVFVVSGISIVWWYIIGAL